MLQVNDQFKHLFSYTQQQVNMYAEISGDTNPLHINEDVGKESVFGKCIIHGFLGASVFTKIFGALWNCDGNIYLKQSMQWLKPMYVNNQYEAVVTVKEIFKDKNKILYTCEIFDTLDNSQTFIGEALLMNKKLYNW